MERIHKSVSDGDRYWFDFNLSKEEGWQPWFTKSDAWYFGIWVNPVKLQVIEYCEGDITIVKCDTAKEFEAELAAKAEFHGEPPASFTIFDSNGVTKIVEPRTMTAKVTP